MNFDDGAAYTHFCYAKSSKKGSSSKTSSVQFVFFVGFVLAGKNFRPIFFDDSDNDDGDDDGDDDVFLLIIFYSWKS